LGAEEELSPKTAAIMKSAMPEAVFVPAGELLMKMRQVKTREEIELTQKAIDLHDAMLEFGRAYILMHGSGTTDFEIRHAIEAWATDTLLPVLKLDGRPHTGVGLSLSISCRAGVSTAYPHPNQFFYGPIRKGDAVQLSTIIRIGGYGGEGYRALHIEPMNDLQKRMWAVHTEMTLLQAELCKAGARCQEIAERVLNHGINAGMGSYIYHRPAHGAGMEGHQPPYLSLGDETVLEENMMFSNEPGLYNPEGGFGYNHSNNVLVQKERGQIMNRTPLTKEWCWLRI
jgi:Xaa-Pro aminopeptidase